MQTFRRVDSLAALAVFILFCMPWLGISDGETVEMIWGLNVPDVAVTFGEVAELGRPVWTLTFW